MISLVVAFSAGMLLGLLVGVVLAAAGTSDAAGEARTVSGDPPGETPP